MQISNLNLGYRVRRDILEPCGGARVALPCIDAQSLIVFPHDLKAFAIPHEHVVTLADTYRRYLIAAYIFSCSVITSDGVDDELDHSEEALLYDRTTLMLIHQAFGVPFKEGRFNLDAAIAFLEEEANLSKTIAIRWCMMMEYITFEDQRLDALLKQQPHSQTNQSEIQEILNNEAKLAGGEDG
jgi:hypothetical protein